MQISRRSFLGSAGIAAAATAPISGAILSSACKKEEAASKRETAALLTLKLSSSLPNDPKFSSGRVTYDALVKQIKAHGLDDRIAVYLSMFS
jgi:nitrous oxide reductase